MSDLTDEAVKALLDGATPGTWRADGEPWNRIVWSSADNRVCFMAHSSGLNDARDIATSNLVAAAPDLARALLDARAELARVKADAAVAVALVVERAVENKEQLDIWAQEILEGLSFADVLKITSYDDKIEAHNIVGRGLVDVIRALAPADGLAAVKALRVEARENAMQALASMGQAQEAYEAQLEAEAELARVKADAQAAVALVVSELRQFVTDSYQCGCMDAGCAGRHAERNSTLEALSETLDALAPADGLAAVDALRAEIADLKMNMDADLRTMVREGQQLRTLAAELAAAQQREAELRGALEMSRQGWRNALELDLLPKQHRHSAKTMADIADAALATQEAGNA